MKKIILVLILIVSLILTGCSQKEELPPQESELKAISQLAAIECYYNNVAKFYEEDATSFLFWTKDKNFWIEYSGIVTMGVDSSLVTLTLNENNVKITLPPAIILDSKVDETSLTEESFYFDKDSAEIELDDQNEAYRVAQEEMLNIASQDEELLNSAQERVKILIEDYINKIGEALKTEYVIEWVLVDENGEVI